MGADEHRPRVYRNAPPLRSQPHRRAAHRRRADGPLQLAAGRGATAARSCCASRTPTASAPRPRTSSRSSTRCAGSSSTSTRARSPRPRAPTATRRRSQQLLDERPRLPLHRDGRGRQGLQGADTAPTAASAASDEGEGAVRLRVPDEGETVVHDVIRGDTRFAHVHLDDPVIARADGSVALQLRGRHRRPRRRHHPRRSAARTTSPTRPSSCSCSRRSARQAPRLRAPAAAARPRRQEALQAPRRGVGAGAARRRLPARGGAQLPRAARLGRRRRRDDHRHRRARRGASTSSASRATRRASTSRSCAG